ncbi:MAG: hypothetical protein ACRDT0_01705 [Pseudonocardiaceae bacterium]
MTWQDELRQLDEELAAGRLSAEDYRRRRDEALAQADAGDTPGDRPADRPADPFPPPFRWETAAPDDTQVMQPVAEGEPEAAPPDTTQVVHGSDQRDDQRDDQGDSDRTQVISGTGSPPQQSPGQPSFPDRPPQQTGEQGANWSPFGGPDSSSPPWAGSDLPPIADQQSAWMRQGPEMFETEGKGSQRKRVVGIAVVAVLLVGLVVAGVFYAVSLGSGDQAGGGDPARTQQPPPPPPAPQLPEPPAPSPPPADTPQALIDPPGEPRAGGGPLDLPKLESESLLPGPIVDSLRAADMTDGVLKTSMEGGTTIGMFAFALRDEQAAVTVTENIATVQRDGGLREDPKRALQGVTVLGTPSQSGSTVVRAVYVLYDRAVYVEAFGADRESVLNNFDQLLADQVNYAPPTVR